MSKQKIIITKDGRKTADIKLVGAGSIKFSKNTVVINDETEPNSKGDYPKAKDIFIMKIKEGNPNAEIIIEK